MYKFVFILLLLFVAAGCHKDRKIGRQLSQIEKIMAIAPDSSLGILKQLNVSDLPTGRAQAVSSDRSIKVPGIFIYTS